jgi:hypothetical protein
VTLHLRVNTGAIGWVTVGLNGMVMGCGDWNHRGRLRCTTSTRKHTAVGELLSLFNRHIHTMLTDTGSTVDFNTGTITLTFKT